jgi:dipeptidyl aminopeptidase/acylaminoacyl peptidase
MKTIRAGRRSIGSSLLWSLMIGYWSQQVPADEGDGMRNGSTARLWAHSSTYKSVAFIPDGSAVVVSTDETGMFNLFEIELSQNSKSTAEKRQLTFSLDSETRFVGFFADAKRIMFSKDNRGNEAHRLYVREEAGETISLTPGDGPFRTQFLGWSEDRSRFLIATNERRLDTFDIYAYEADSYSRKLVFSGDPDLAFFDLFDRSLATADPTLRYVAVTRLNSNRDSDVLLIDLATGKTENISMEDADALESPLEITPSGILYYLTDRHSEWKYLSAYSISTGRHSTVLQAEGDVIALKTNPERLGVLVNKNGRNTLKIASESEWRTLEVEAFSDGSIDSFDISADGKTMAVIYADSSHLGDVYVLDPKSSLATAVTDGLHGDIVRRKVPHANNVSYRSFDGTRIFGWLYVPQRRGEHRKKSAIVWVHGGPGGQAMVGGNMDASRFPFTQFLVDQGYTLLAINYRGGSGYGKAFMRLDDQRHGTSDLIDVAFAKYWLVEERLADPECIAVIGESYGGYLAFGSMARLPGLFASAVSIYGSLGMEGILGSLPPWWQALKRGIFTEFVSPMPHTEYYESISYAAHAKAIRDPVLMLQGERDARASSAVASEIVDELKTSGADVKYVEYPGEGHGFVRKTTKIDAMEQIAAFLRETIPCR